MAIYTGRIRFVVALLPLNPAVVLTADGRPPSFHSDPFARLIIATAHAHVMQLAARAAAIPKSPRCIAVKALPS